MYDFDTLIDRRGTGSLKWDRFNEPDVIPMWVADMDFQAPPPVLDALRRHVEHGIFGYAIPTVELTETLCRMLWERFRWRVDPTWMVWLPGLVTGLNLACRAVGDVGSDVMTTTPIYPPFLSAPRESGRGLVTVPMQNVSNRWVLDTTDCERARTARTKLFLLCHPHNPTGRLFTLDELTEIGDFCLAHDIAICSDEIHCDLVLDNREHIPTATVSAAVADRTITLMAPSKTFNVPGLSCAYAIIPNQNLRRRFMAQAGGIVPDVNALGLTACLAAYRDGYPWLRELLAYLRENRDVVLEAINGSMPGLSVTPIEATYLAWIDARQARLPDPDRAFLESGVRLSDGALFGTPGYLRLNFGCSRSLLERGLQRMSAALARG